MPSSSHSWSAQLSGGQLLFIAACWHTQYHTTASPASSYCSQRHFRFKLFPTTALPKFSPIGATATIGDVTPSGRLTDIPLTSLRITSEEDIFQANIALLFAPQEGASHAILGLCLAPAGVCGISQTQLLAKRTAAKNAKCESDEDKNSPLQLIRPSLSQRKRSSLPNGTTISSLPPPCSRPPSLNFLPPPSCP
jgi:hypothetical protein